MTPLRARSRPVWLFDLDNTLHNASHAAFGEVSQGMGEYIMRHLGMTQAESDALRRRYWSRYGATLLGLIRHHAVDAHHFLAETHALPGLEARVHSHKHDLAALRRLPGRKVILTNAPRRYTERVLSALGIARLFDEVIAIEDLRMFGHWRPKPDVRMMRALLAQLQVPAGRCVLVEDSLENQKAAHRLGIGTVWMLRWMREATWGGAAATRTTMQPAYVDRRVRSLASLARGRR